MTHHNPHGGWDPRYHPHAPPPNGYGYGHPHYGHPDPNWGHYHHYGYRRSRMSLVVRLVKTHKTLVLSGLLIVFVLACLAFLAVLKIGIAVYESPVTHKVASTAAVVSIVAADGAMKKMEVPDDTRSKLVKEVSALKKDLEGMDAATPPPPMAKP